MADFGTKPHRTINVCHVCSSLPQGGLAVQLLTLAKARPAFIRFHLITTNFNGYYWADALKYFSSCTSIATKNKYYRYFRLWRKLRELRPDIVQVHQEVYAPIVARLAGASVILETIHSGTYWLAQGRPLGRLMRHQCITRYVAVSTALSHELAENGLSLKRIITIENGVETRTPRNLAKKEFYTIGTLTRLDRGKGVEHLIVAFSRVQEKIHNCRLLIAGDGPLMGFLRDLAHSLGVLHRMSFLGYISNPKEFLARLDVFVFPSLSEGFGLALAEAMASGVPVVASRIASIGALCRDRIDGILVTPGNPDDIESAIIELHADQWAGSRMAESGRSRIELHYSAASMAERYSELYLELLKGGGSRTLCDRRTYGAS